MFLSESLQQEFGLINPGQLNGVPINIANVDEKKCLRPHQEFAVGNDYYFYPSAAVPPPKYNEIAEAILMDSSDDEHDAATCSTTVRQKQDDARVIAAKNGLSNNKSNSVVDI